MYDYTEVYINTRERKLIRHIREQLGMGKPCMVMVRSKTGKKSFGFPIGDTLPGDEIDV